MENNYFPNRPMPIGGHYIIKWGEDNRYPQMIREVARENGLVSQILNKHFELLWGQGPQLYSIDFVNGRRRKHWIIDKAIEAWLAEWDYREYLEKVTGEFLQLNGYFTTFYCIQKERTRFTIAKLEFLDCDQARFQWSGNDSPATSVVVGDFALPGLFGFKLIPLFDPEKPRTPEISIGFEYVYQAGIDNYPKSPFHGSLSWIQAGTQTARLVSAFNANSISPKYHIEVPDLYWEKLRDQLKDGCQNKGISYQESMLHAEIDQIFLEVSNALSGIDKVGKFLVTEILTDALHQKYVGWVITPIETRTRDYLSGQLKIAHESSFNVSAGMGMHPALTGLKKKGGLSTGSELEYASKIYQQVSTEFAERSIMKNINTAIAINFPGIGTKLGFNHDDI